MTEPQHFEICTACGGHFEFGMHKYYGRKNPTYNIMICKNCDTANWDGWALQLEQKVTARLLEQGKLLPERNASGLLPRD